MISTMTGKAASAKIARSCASTEKKGLGDGVQPVLCPQGWLLKGECSVLSFHLSHSTAFSHFTKALSPQDVMLEQLLHLHSHPISFQDNFLTLTCPQKYKSIRLWLHLALGWSLTR